MQITPLSLPSGTNSALAPVVNDKVADVHPLARTPTVAAVGNAAAPPAAKLESKNNVERRRSEDAQETRRAESRNSDDSERGASLDVII